MKRHVSPQLGQHDQSSVTNGCSHIDPVQPGRRRLLSLLLALGTLFCGWNLSRFFGRFLHAPAPQNSYGATVVVGPVNELPTAGSPPTLVPHGRFWLVHSQDGLTALHNGCTHLDCLVSWDQERQQFTCPCHGSTFAVNGQQLSGPAPRPLDRFPVLLINENGESIRHSTAVASALPVNDFLIRPETVEESESEPQPVTAVTVVVDTSKKIRVT